MPVNDPHNDNDDGNLRMSDKRFLQGGEMSLVSVNAMSLIITMSV